ncbi:hypothetical protein EVAR_19712_1 [Eumeta japonica]|uniref:Uncharacterized protein n=1 Tax=Eumeta variegata TaxID=151549 RepID=A0A4C1UQG2_EUMVA|nr:hypothetical protein EVAR_19712_1 [Eumeta japonica]
MCQTARHIISAVTEQAKRLRPNSFRRSAPGGTETKVPAGRAAWGGGPSDKLIIICHWPNPPRTSNLGPRVIAPRHHLLMPREPPGGAALSLDRSKFEQIIYGRTHLTRTELPIGLPIYEVKITSNNRIMVIKKPLSRLVSNYVERARRTLLMRRNPETCLITDLKDTLQMLAPVCQKFSSHGSSANNHE